MIGGLTADQVGNNHLRQEFKRFGVAKKLGDIDELVLDQQIKFFRVLAQCIKILCPMVFVIAIAMRRSIRRCSVPLL
jgi:hypothetical protein